MKRSAKSGHGELLDEALEIGHEYKYSNITLLKTLNIKLNIMLNSILNPIFLSFILYHLCLMYMANVKGISTNKLWVLFGNMKIKTIPARPRVAGCGQW
jgi:hypothetical protein